MFRKKINYRKYLKKEHPDFIRNYIQCFEEAQQDNSIYDCRFIVFDTETTGLNIRKDDVISIGAVALDNLEICVTDSLEICIQRDNTGDKNSVVIHQILSKETLNGCDEIQALKQFLNFIGSSVLVAHHANFDIQMMSRILKKHYGFSILNKYIDTSALARRIDFGRFSNSYQLTSLREYSLDNLCKRFKIPIHGRHTAAGDALATAKLLQILLFKAINKKITFVKELV